MTIKDIEKITGKEVVMRSCWNCNSGHKHLKKQKDFIIWCFACGNLYYNGKEKNRRTKRKVIVMSKNIGIFQYHNVIIDPEQVEFCYDYQEGVMVYFKSGNHTYVFDTNVSDFQTYLVYYLKKIKGDDEDGE